MGKGEDVMFMPTYARTGTRTRWSHKRRVWMRIAVRHLQHGTRWIDWWAKEKIRVCKNTCLDRIAIAKHIYIYIYVYMVYRTSHATWLDGGEWVREIRN